MTSPRWKIYSGNNIIKKIKGVVVEKSGIFYLQNFSETIKIKMLGNSKSLKNIIGKTIQCAGFMEGGYLVIEKWRTWNSRIERRKL